MERAAGGWLAIWLASLFVGWLVRLGWSRSVVFQICGVAVEICGVAVAAAVGGCLIPNPRYGMG